MNTNNGFCECGCGKLAGLSTRDKNDIRKGEPRHFAHGHHPRKAQTKFYRRAPRGEGFITGKRLALHILRAERALGRPLPPGAEVHHVDCLKTDDAPLVICQDNSYHKLLHVRMRVRAAGGDPNTQAVCSACRLPKNYAEFYGESNRLFGINSTCRPCHFLRRQKRRRHAAAGARA